jgi:hypothetical protein
MSIIRAGESYDTEVRRLQRRLREAEADRDYYKAMVQRQALGTPGMRQGHAGVRGQAHGPRGAFDGATLGKRLAQMVKAHTSDLAEKLAERMDANIDDLEGQILDLKKEVEALRGTPNDGETS